MPPRSHPARERGHSGAAWFRGARWCNLTVAGGLRRPPGALGHTRGRVALAGRGVGQKLWATSGRGSVRDGIAREHTVSSEQASADIDWPHVEHLAGRADQYERGCRVDRGVAAEALIGDGDRSVRGVRTGAASVPGERAVEPAGRGRDWRSGRPTEKWASLASHCGIEFTEPTCRSRRPRVAGSVVMAASIFPIEC